MGTTFWGTLRKSCSFPNDTAQCTIVPKSFSGFRQNNSWTIYNTTFIWNLSSQNTKHCTLLLLACSKFCANTDIYLWVFFHCCQDSKIFCLSHSPHFSAGSKSPPVFWQYQQMKDVTSDPSVNAQKSDRFTGVCPYYLVLTEKDNLKELKKFKIVLRSMLLLEKNLSKAGEK